MAATLTGACGGARLSPAPAAREVAAQVEPYGHLARPVRGAPPGGATSGARLLPVALEEARFRAPEPGGAMRAVVAGMRVLALADGTMDAAPDRFSASPTAVVRVPDRLGGGFLFAISKQLWRSDRWLSAAAPIYTAGLNIT
ncbi:MAG: hypothetical protein FWD17_16375, partial [Polyangiaceae bacterium]|nr:hypothetical protein [Polyangiaceae bacterium]